MVRLSPSYFELKPILGSGLHWVVLEFFDQEAGLSGPDTEAPSNGDSWTLGAQPAGQG